MMFRSASKRANLLKTRSKTCTCVPVAPFSGDQIAFTSACRPICNTPLGLTAEALLLEAAGALATDGEGARVAAAALAAGALATDGEGARVAAAALAAGALLA